MTPMNFGVTIPSTMHNPIIQSFLDDDLYKITQASAVFHMFPRTIVTYKFFNRGKTVFPHGFTDALRRQINHLSDISLTAAEAKWLLTKVTYIRPTYVEWLQGFRMNPDDVDIIQIEQ